MNCDVIIPVYNDNLIYRAINSVPIGTNIIIGCSASPQEFINNLKCVFKERIKIAYSPNKGMSSALNAAVKMSTNANIIVLDSDCYFQSPDSIREYCDSLVKFKFVRGVTKVEKSSIWSKMAAKGTEELNDKFALSPRLFGPSIAFDRDAFLTYGGYDKNMIHGSCDHEFSLRLEKRNERITFNRNAICFHKPITFSVDVKSHFGYGKGMKYIDIKYQTTYGLKVCLDRFSYSSLRKKLLRRGPLSVLRSLLLGSVMLFGYFILVK